MSVQGSSENDLMGIRAKGELNPDALLVDCSHGLVAQGIERLRPKEGVGGSSPSEAAKTRG